jgi:hypothetical protein
MFLGMALRSACGERVAAQAPRPAFGDLNFYWGDLHAHSGYSPDGAGTPEEAYDSARARNNDFFALTDHDQAFIDYPYLCLDGVDNGLAGTPEFECRPDQLVYVGSREKWDHLKEVAQSRMVEGEFAALYGYEWTHLGGHANVLQAPNFVHMGLALPAFLDALIYHPDRDLFILMLNHPYEGFDFDGLRYHPQATPLFSLIETNHFAPRYPLALKNGWRVGAVGYGDNHYAPLSGTRRYGIVASELTEESVTSALKNRHTFGVLDGREGTDDYPLAVALRINGTLMGGETLHNGSLDYEIYLRDDLRDITRARLLYGGSYEADYYVARDFVALGRERLLRGRVPSLIFGMPDRADYAWVEVWQYDEERELERTVAWTAPVWLEYDPAYVPSPTPTPTLRPTATAKPTISETPGPIAVCLPLILVSPAAPPP